MAKQSLPKQRSRVRFPYPAPKISQIYLDLGDFLEQDTGIEPATVAWEATVFPLN